VRLGIFDLGLRRELLRHEQRVRLREIAQHRRLAEPLEIGQARPAADDIERALLPWCREHGTGVVCYEPQQTGLLSGAFDRARLATLPDDGPRGGFFRNREPIPW